MERGEHVDEFDVSFEVARVSGQGVEEKVVLIHLVYGFYRIFFFSSRRRHTRFDCDWSSDVCSSDLVAPPSVLLNSPEPLGAVALSPPERNVQPRRRKSHIPAYSVLGWAGSIDIIRSEEHTSELQSQSNLVCRLLLEKKKTTPTPHTH